MGSIGGRDGKVTLDSRARTTSATGAHKAGRLAIPNPFVRSGGDVVDFESRNPSKTESAPRPAARRGPRAPALLSLRRARWAGKNRLADFWRGRPQRARCPYVVTAQPSPNTEFPSRPRKEWDTVLNANLTGISPVLKVRRNGYARKPGW